MLCWLWLFVRNSALHVRTWILHIILVALWNSSIASLEISLNACPPFFFFYLKKLWEHQILSVTVGAECCTPRLYLKVLSVFLHHKWMAPGRRGGINKLRCSMSNSQMLKSSKCWFSLVNFHVIVHLLASEFFCVCFVSLKGVDHFVLNATIKIWSY